MDTLTVFEFEMNLANYIDSVKLPAEVKRLVIERLLGEITADRDKELRLQVENREKDKETKNAENVCEGDMGERTVD